MKTAKLIGETFAPLVDLLYPPRCPLCGDGLGQQSGLCVECWSTLSVPGEPECSTCQLPLLEQEFDGEEAICGLCAVEPPMHKGIAAAAIYNQASRKLILLFKHGRKIALAPMLARLMAARIAEPEETSPLLIPVPLHRFRLWKRGYNQAGLLARELERLGKGDLLVDGLLRQKSTPSLGGLGKAQRNGALANAIAVKPARLDAISGREILLVDDVLTSGATTNACVQALLKAGAQSVKIACFARVVDGYDEIC